MGARGVAGLSQIVAMMSLLLLLLSRCSAAVILLLLPLFFAPIVNRNENVFQLVRRYSGGRHEIPNKICDQESTVLVA
jgi:hypothetical protein